MFTIMKMSYITMHYVGNNGKAIAENNSLFGLFFTNMSIFLERHLICVMVAVHGYGIESWHMF